MQNVDMSNLQRRELRTAIHEAAHGVVATLVGARVYHASIIPSASSFGRLTYRPPLTFEQHVALITAGPLATCRFYRTHDPNVLFRISPTDWAKIHALARQRYGAKRMHWRRNMRRIYRVIAAADAAVSTHWNAIVAVARLLLEHDIVHESWIRTTIDHFEKGYHHGSTVLAAGTFTHPRARTAAEADS